MNEKTTHYKTCHLMKSFLFILNSLVFVLSLFVSLFLISEPNGSILHLSTSLLQNSPFLDFSMPGFFLLVTVCLISLVALMFQITSNKKMYSWTLASGVALMVWVLIQHMIINKIIWSDYFLFTFSLLIILISLQLQGKKLI